MPWLSWLPSLIGGLFSGGGITALSKELSATYDKILAARNTSERIEAEREAALISARMEIVIAEQRNWATRWIRPAFAFPFIVYNAKVVIWDKVLGLGVTDSLSEGLWQLQMVVFGAYFVLRPVERWGASRVRR